MHKRNIFSQEFNKYLQNIEKWVHTRKMYFNPDVNKQAQHRFIFFGKQSKTMHPQVFLTSVFRASNYKHLGKILNEN